MYSIEKLPNEIIYRIYDYIDVCSIINLSYTSRIFYYCRNNYNSYKINFESISKVYFDLICRIIYPENIISLKLFDNDNTPGQIKSFIKNFQINKLKRLKYLKLIKINENDLESILKHIINNRLNYLEIEYRQYFTILNQSTIFILQNILSYKTLQEVNLDMRFYQNDFIQWPQSTHIQYLTLFNSNIYQFNQIIEKQNQFKSIILKNFTMKYFNDILFKKNSLKQLKSFKIEESELFMEKIQLIISLMSELIYLKLEGYTNIIENIFRNNELEEFFQTKLIHLKTFEFFIRFSPKNEFLRDNLIVDSFIKQFQRSYWISNLNCFINCDLIRNSNEIHLYSIPSIFNYFKYSDQINMISYSTSSSTNYLNERFHFVYHLELNLKDLEIVSMQIKNNEEDNRLFPKLNYLKLTVNDQCSFDCFKLLSKSVYLKNLEKLVLIICSRGSYLNLMIKNFLIFLKNLSNINSIEIFNRWHGIFSFIDINYFCSMIPYNIKHLDIDIFEIDHIEILIDKLENVSSFKFKFAFDKSLYLKQILQLLDNKKINSTYISDIHYLSIWISKQFNRTNSNKRIKLTN
ncbi:unnamed protein product [Rotaria sp. Silwood1]|nr:unnamed protein product [Rotaria sp. Silwood1]